MSRTLKVTSNRVMYDGSAWFLRVIMSSLRILCCLLSVKKQKHDFQVCFVDHRLRRWSLKNSWRQGHTKHKKVDEGGKEAVHWLCERENTERTWGKERGDTNFENIHFVLKQERRIRLMYNKTIIRFGFCDIKNNQGLRKGYQAQPITLPPPWLFWISQKPHPIATVYYCEKPAWDVESHSLHVKVSDFAPVMVCTWGNSSYHTVIMKITRAHNLHVKMLDFN